MRVGFCQYEPVFGEVAENLDRVSELADPIRADLLVLPELFATGYQFRDRDESAALAEEYDGATISWAKKTARKTGIAICGGFAEKAGEKIYNAAFFASPDETVHIYRKIHLFDREKLTFDPGDRRFEVFDYRGVKVGMMICFDWFFPESMRTLALLGAQIVCHPSNLVLAWCQDAMRTRCLENRVFAVTANRIGTEDRVPNGSALAFTGQSQITATRGEILHRAAADESRCVVVEIDPAQALSKQATARNDLFADRRPEFYTTLTEGKP